MSLPDFPLGGRRIILTGASSGIGRAAVRRLVEAGAHVLATGRREERLAALRSDLSGAAGTLDTLAGDLTDAAFVDRLALQAGAVDILINNAGLLHHAPFLDSDPADWREVFDANVLGLLRLTQAVARCMAAAGGGHIVNVSSVLAREVTPYTLVYAASKHAVRAISEGLRVELAGHGIKVSEVAPGLVTTEINRGITNPEVKAYYEARAGTFPYLEPADIAEGILYAVSAGANVAPEFIEIRPARQRRALGR